MDLDIIDILIISGIISLMIVSLALIFTKFRPLVNRSVDKMTISSYVRRNKIQDREDFIRCFWSDKEKNAVNEYLFNEGLEQYDKYIDAGKG